MESELERLQRSNEELQAWIRDLLEENRALRQRIAEDEPSAGSPSSAAA